MKTKSAAAPPQITQVVRPQKNSTEPPSAASRMKRISWRAVQMGRKVSMTYALPFFQVLLASLREIFDENSYQRFLDRTGQTASVQSYREFQREREVGVATRPRCC